MFRDVPCLDCHCKSAVELQHVFYSCVRLSVDRGRWFYSSRGESGHAVSLIMLLRTWKNVARKVSLFQAPSEKQLSLFIANPKPLKEPKPLQGTLKGTLNPFKGLRTIGYDSEATTPELYLSNIPLTGSWGLVTRVPERCTGSL